MDYNRDLTPYQMVHLLKVKSNGLNGLLVSDGVGVGKTISAGYIIEYCLKVLKKSCIICCPPVLEQKWIEELKVRFGIRAYSTKKTEDYRTMEEELNHTTNYIPHAYVLPYSTLKNRSLSRLTNVGCVIYDEIHHSRNHETKLYSSLIELSKISTYRVGLSATPIHNSLGDLSSAMSLIFPILERDSWNLIVNELWSRNKVHFLHPFITKFDKTKLGIHFTKREVIQIETDFNPSFLNSVELTIDKMGERRGEELSSFEKSIFLRLASSSPAAFFKSQNREIPENYEDSKLNRMVNLINEEGPGRWLIFTEFRATAEVIANKLHQFQPAIISGDSSISERYLAIDDFHKNENGVLIMMPVGCEGLDLQICSRLINYDLHWNPMVIEQRIGRIDRIGQNKESIRVYNFIVLGSIDHHMISIMKDKLGIVSDTFANIEAMLDSGLDSQEYSEMSDEYLSKNGLDIMSKLSNSLPDTDYSLQGLLSIDICKPDLWPDEISDWDNLLEVIQNPKAAQITNQIRVDSMELIEIISDYM